MKKGCIVIHGLLGTPSVMSPISRKLLEEGYQVIAPSLAGHSSVGDLAKSNWEEWYSSVHKAYSQLRKDVDQVYYVGLSLGALLGLKLVIEEGWNIKALVLMGTPLNLSFKDSLLTNFVRYSPLRTLIKSVKRDLERSVSEPIGKKIYSQISLDRMPASSVFQIQNLQKTIKADISKVANPLLLMHGFFDDIAPIENIQLVEKMVSSEVVESFIARKSKHIITLDYDKDDVVKKSIEFLNKYK